jgi:hypothetical protein
VNKTIIFKKEFVMPKGKGYPKKKGKKKVKK